MNLQEQIQDMFNQGMSANEMRSMLEDMITKEEEAIKQREAEEAAKKLFLAQREEDIKLARLDVAEVLMDYFLALGFDFSDEEMESHIKEIVDSLKENETTFKRMYEFSQKLSKLQGNQSLFSNPKVAKVVIKTKDKDKPVKYSDHDDFILKRFLEREI